MRTVLTAIVWINPRRREVVVNSLTSGWMAMGQTKTLSLHFISSTDRWVSCHRFSSELAYLAGYFLTSSAALKAIGVVLSEPEPKPAPLLASNPLQSIAAVLPEPMSREQNPTEDLKEPNEKREQNDEGLTKAEIIAIIAIYRGHISGLQNFTEKELLGLLKYHRVSYMF